MKSKDLSNYILHMVDLIKHQALEIKNEANRKEGEDLYKEGELMAYYSVMSTLKNHASFYDLEQKDIGLENMNLESDLLGKK
ncbi:hypothetical protein [Candidatus Neptunichlamydia sp. REUL1]|uniref:hypothetical protein n=1 Tax=Candidatus Neptunichlamydia sp. REUL1 TaxID=3064277 RepID=UPI002930AF1C|nr:hypothetical protein [Candidatus Neptunochlamydia sp. REUL1]